MEIAAAKATKTSAKKQYRSCFRSIGCEHESCPPRPWDAQWFIPRAFGRSDSGPNLVPRTLITGRIAFLTTKSRLRKQLIFCDFSAEPQARQGRSVPFTRERSKVRSPCAPTTTADELNCLCRYVALSPAGSTSGFGMDAGSSAGAKKSLPVFRKPEGLLRRTALSSPKAGAMARGHPPWICPFRWPSRSKRVC
jgi:hypothetical protein